MDFDLGSVKVSCLVLTNRATPLRHYVGFPPTKLATSGSDCVALNFSLGDQIDPSSFMHDAG